ncbi:hypothetical protein VitviT2T_006155 [Vitis vinifera]|uniref:30S ribosomal protein S6 n=2 Tax=Vitis vinifera TaxID=29760 RepID=D7SYH9_VITVI|eukprot:XP_002273724.1 PREDICTED: uncharacterized protein LOC100243195 [Vitis vinifera]
MDALVRTPHITTNLTPKLIRLVGNGGITWNQTPFLTFSKGYSSISANRLRKSVVAEAKKRKKDSVDAHNFVPKPDEATGVFPEAVLLKEKKAQEDGSFLPEFADAEEEELYEFLNLQLESDLNVERMRHYEVVYLIHEKHDEEVENVNSKVQDFIREKKGKLWRLNDWGLRRLAYKIQKAKNAHYILMNFELEAQWINDFKTMLDQDERVIRHLVIKRDEAITEDCPPPPEFHTLRAGTDDYDDEEDDVDYDDEDDWDGEGEVDSNSYSDDVVDVIVPVNSDDREDKNVGRRNLRAEKVGR